MNRVGTVVRVAQGMLVVRSPAESVPPIGTAVVDDALDPVGSVVDVFGPVSRPYVVIDPANPDQAAAINRRVYAQ